MSHFFCIFALLYRGYPTLDYHPFFILPYNLPKFTMANLQGKRFKK